MASYNNPFNKPNPSTEPPPLLRMLHPTSGRENFNQINYQAGFPSQLLMDPRSAMMINMQTQRAIAASSIPTGLPYQGATIPGASPYGYGYGIYQPYAYYPRS